MRVAAAFTRLSALALAVLFLVLLSPSPAFACGISYQDGVSVQDCPSTPPLVASVVLGAAAAATLIILGVAAFRRGKKSATDFTNLLRAHLPTPSGPPTPADDTPLTVIGQAVTWNDVSELLPVDDSGYQVVPEDCAFLGISPQAVQDWHTRQAPLGMSPEQYSEFRGTMYDGLRADGFTPEQVDARLQGSSANFFSGPHKTLPTQSEIADEEARRRYQQWRGHRQEHPVRRPFDSMHRLGLDDEPSDYDVQLSSDAMLAKAEKVRQRNFPDLQLLHPRYGFVRKAIAEVAFPQVTDWASRQSAKLGRPVVPAVFPGSGPPDRTSSGGPSSHFRPDDWRINPRKER
jgi:hypothetical protein